MDAADKNMVIKVLVDGKANELLDLLLGDSPLRISGEPEFTSNEAKDSYVMTIEHLKFISRFGLRDGPVQENEKVYFSYPDYFEKWFQFGTPGLTQADLLSYLSQTKE